MAHDAIDILIYDSSFTFPIFRKTMPDPHSMAGSAAKPHQRTGRKMAKTLAPRSAHRRGS